MDMARRALLAASFVLVTANIARAEIPRVHFDLPYAIACRDVTPPEFAAMNPAEKLIEVRLEVSSLLLAGEERDLTQLLVRIESPRRSLTVVDYLPKTTRESPLAGPIQKEFSKETSTSLGINLSGQYELISAAGINGGIGQKNASCVKYELLPPMETVAASGTLLRGTSVFFKLRSSPRHLLEGSREFALVMHMPAEWRADYLHIHCRADGIERSFVSTFDDTVCCGQRDFLVPIYLEGDQEARGIAEDFARKEAQLRTSLRQPERTQSRRSPSRTEQTKDVEDWLPQFLYGSQQVSSLPAGLSTRAHQAAAEFALARERIADLTSN